MNLPRNLWLVCFGIAVALVVAALTARVMSGGLTGNEGPLPVPTAVISLAASEAEDIPFYPGAEVTKRDDRSLPVTRYTVYYAPASRQEVISFYKQSLLSKDGWSIRSSEDENGVPSRIHFLWKDRGNATPWRVNLHISAIPPVSRDAAGRATVQVSVDRWPDPKIIPLYPDAQDVIANERIHRDSQPDLERSYTTYYKTEATPDQVNAYYRMTLPQYGWHPDDEADSNVWSLVPDGIQFSYRFGGPEGMSGGDVGIFALRASSRVTQVKISSVEFGVP